MKAQHAYIGGDSGTGKTTVGRKYHNEFDSVSIYANYTDEDDVAGYQAAGYEGLQSGLDHFDTWSDVCLNLVGQKPPEERLALALTFAVDLFDTAWQHPDFNGVQIIAPEFHKVLPDDSRGTGNGPGTWDLSEDCPAKWALREGRDKGIKLVGDTQTPNKLDYDALGQVRWWVWCGEPAGIHEGFFRYHSWLPREELPTEDYSYVTMDKKGRVVYRGETEEKYAKSFL